MKYFFKKNFLLFFVGCETKKLIKSQLYIYLVHRVQIERERENVNKSEYSKNNQLTLFFLSFNEIQCIDYFYKDY